MLKDMMLKIDFQKRALDAASLKHDVIAQNIANVETPGYKRKEVVFETFLQDAMDGRYLPMVTTNPAHMNPGFAQAPYIRTDRSFSNRIDGNNVNVDVEMAEQAKNNIRYNALITQISSQLRRMKAAIKGGR